MITKSELSSQCYKLDQMTKNITTYEQLKKLLDKNPIENAIMTAEINGEPVGTYEGEKIEYITYMWKNIIGTYNIKNEKVLVDEVIAVYEALKKIKMK